MIVRLVSRWLRQGRGFRSRPAAALAILAVLQGHAITGDREYRIQGVFCNTELQIDEVVAHMKKQLTARSAVELANSDEVVCNYVDRIQYVIHAPVVIGLLPGDVPFIKYEAILTGVIVGGTLRQVAPPIRIFFVSPERLVGAALEKRA